MTIVSVRSSFISIAVSRASGTRTVFVWWAVASWAGRLSSVAVIMPVASGGSVRTISWPHSLGLSFLVAS